MQAFSLEGRYEIWYDNNNVTLLYDKVPRYDLTMKDWNFKNRFMERTWKKEFNADVKRRN